MSDEREEIRARIDIVDLVQQRVVLKRSGKNFLGLCPFHEDRRPSFYVSPVTGRYTCFSCGEKGDIFTWVEKTQNMSFREALEYLAARAGVELTRGKQNPEEKSARARFREAMELAIRFWREQLEKSEGARAYCQRRDLNQDVLKKWELGYAPDVREALGTFLKKNGVVLSEAQQLFLVDQDAGGGYRDKFWGRLMFPIRDERGDLVAFGGRILGDGHPKYINSSDTPLFRKSRVLYGLNYARDPIAKVKQAILVEGYLDVIACHRAGVETAVASLGTALAEEQARLLKRFADEVVILYDRDSAGVKAAERAVSILQAEGLRARVALMPPGEDPDTLLKAKGPEALRQVVQAAGSPTDFFISRLEETHQSKDDAFWNEVVDLLRHNTNPVEVERQIERLVGRYSAVRDQIGVRESLRRRIFSGQTRERSRQRGPMPMVVRTDLPVAEATVFAGLLDPELCISAFEALKNPRWIRSDGGQALRLEVLKIMPEGPKQAVAQWMQDLSEVGQQEFLKIQADARFTGVSLDLTGAVATLDRDSKKADIEDRRSFAQSPADLNDVLARMKRLKGGDEPS